MANTRLTRTAGTPTNNSKWTISVWLKRTALGLGDGFIFDAYVSANDRFKFAFQSADKLEIWNSNGGSDDATLTPNRTFVDTSAWYHLLLSMDATLSTATDRFKLYVNGVRETDFGTNVNPPQNSTEFVVNQNGATLAIGDYHGGSNAFDGCMSHFHFIDGTAYDPTTFGETHTSGEWKIKTSPSVTYGNNGFFLFKDNASVTDQSGNSNNFTVANGTLLETKDNPSNNHPILNRELPGTPPTDDIGGCLQIKKTNSGYKPGLATFGAFAGKYYAEFKLESDYGYTNFGVVNVFKKAALGTGDSLDYIGDGDDGVAYQPGSSSLYHNGSSSGSYGTAAQNDIIGVALDIDNGYVYWSKNGTFLNSGVPTSGSTGTGGYALSNLESTLGNYYVFGVSVAGTSGTRKISCNFGQGFFGTTAVSSNSGDGYAGADGNSKFYYQPPTGYSAMNTKGLNV